MEASEDIPSGVSIESASYIENNELNENEDVSGIVVPNEEDNTPKLFSEDTSYQIDESAEASEQGSVNSESLFDQEISEEDDFEIPAFLRKQKF